MKSYLLLFFTLLFLSLLAQEKGAAGVRSSTGATPLADDQSPTGTTRAVIIGISDYLEPEITDLQYAHKDAEAFADWLQSPAGGSVPKEHIMLHTNEAATNMQIIMSIEWLIEQSKPGDRAIIYLSGHGDVERVTKYSVGFFLGYDSPHKVYGAGALSLDYLKKMVTTMSEEDVQVFVISDACRAGKLAGSEIGGPQATANQLAKQFNNEIVLLSCQPDQFSLEGEQWGGGRGIFSYHLENALYGMADRNQDLSIDLREVRNYLEEKIPEEASPNQQLPLINGPILTPVTSVDPPTLADWQSRLQETPVAFKDTEDRAMEQFPDSLLYDQFLTAIEDGNLMSPEGESANDYYEVLISNPEWERFHGHIKRKFVVALADEAQLVVNKLLRTDPQIIDEAFPGRVRYAHLPAYLERATEILGKQHYMYRYLKCKQHYFEAKTYSNTYYPDLSTDTLAQMSLRALDKALTYDSMAAYVYLEKGLTCYWKISISPSICIPHFEKAVELSPSWVLAIYYYGRTLSEAAKFSKSNDILNRGLDYLEKVLQYDSNFIPAYEQLGSQLRGEVEGDYWQNRYVQKMEDFIREDSLSIPATYYRYLGWTYYYMKRYEDMEEVALKFGKLTNYELPIYYKMLWEVNLAKGKEKEACECLIKYYRYKPNIPNIPRLTYCNKKVIKQALKYHKKRCVRNHRWACNLYRYYNLEHNFQQSRKIGEEHIGLIDRDTVMQDNGYGRWYYGSPASAEVTLKKYAAELEETGDIAEAELECPKCPYGLLVMVNLAQNDLEEAEYWWEKRNKIDASYNHGTIDGWGYGIHTWLAYAQGRYEEADSLIAYHSKYVPVKDLIEDMLTLISICGQVDYAIFCLEKSLEYFPTHVRLHYHLARLHIEQKNNYKKGIPLLEKAIALDPEHAYSHYHLGAAYLHQGKKEASLEQLALALEHGYDGEKWMEEDERWEGVRDMEEFRELVEDYLLEKKNE